MSGSFIYVRYDASSGKVVQPISTPTSDYEIATKEYVDSTSTAYDQTLNTTDNVTFAGVDVDGTLTSDIVEADDYRGATAANTFSLGVFNFDGPNINVSQPMTLGVLNYTVSIPGGLLYNHSNGTDILDEYEKFSTTDLWTAGTGWSQSVTVNVVKVGALVTLNVSGASGTQTSDGFINSVVSCLPRRFRPIRTFLSRDVVVWSGGVIVPNAAVRVVNTFNDVVFEIGNVVSHASPPNGGLGIGVVAFDDFTVSYYTDISR